jgi:allantoicase
MKTFFEKQYNRHITHNEIDHQKFGKWLLGWTRLKKISKYQWCKISLSAKHFCDAYDISTYADLVRFFKQKKVNIKSKIGRRSAWELKILSLNDYSRFEK